MTSAVCDISVCCRLSRLKVKEAFRTFRDWLAVQLHIPASTFCHCCINTATVESFPMSLACGPKGHFGKCNGYEDIKSHKNSYKFTIFYSCVRACVQFRSCGLSSRWWKRGRRGMFMKTQQTLISISSGIWYVTVSAISAVFSVSEHLLSYCWMFWCWGAFTVKVNLLWLTKSIMDCQSFDWAFLLWFADFI